jgi:HK97 family phage portal protein
MSFFPSFKSRKNIEEKQGNYLLPFGFGGAGQGYQSNWPIEKAIEIGLTQNPWVFRAAHAIASNAAGLPFILRLDNQVSGLKKDDPLLKLLNQYPNDYETSYNFRYRLSQQILLSKTGAFIRLNRTRGGELIGLSLIPPAQVIPKPDKKTFVSEYVVGTGPDEEHLAPEDVLWIKLPHPTDPWQGLTPLEAAGMAIETDILARKYNRNFLQNDGRPSGILAVKGGMEEADANILRNRFLGPALGNGPNGAGRITVLDVGEDGVDWVDTATNPREAQYVQMMEQVKNVILICFGVPESIAGNSSNRTYDNAAAEVAIFWRETMLPHINLIGRALDRLADEGLLATFDTSMIYVLDKDKRESDAFHLEELKSNAINVDRYLEKTGQDTIGDKHRYINKNLLPYTDDGVLDEESNHPDTQPAPEPAPVVVAPPSANDSGNENDNADSPTTTPVGEPFDVAKNTSTFNLRVKSWEGHVEKQMQTFFKRQERVITEKLLSRKLKEKWESGSEIFHDEIFDYNRWNEQLGSDVKGWADFIAADFNISTPEGLLGAVIAENDQTLKFINQFLKKARSDKASLDSVASDIKSIFDAAVNSRSKKVAEAVMKIIVSSLDTK